MLAHLVEGAGHIAGRIAGETGQADVANLTLGVDKPIPGGVGLAAVAEHAFHLDTVANELDLALFVFSLALDEDGHGRTGLAQNFLHSIIGGQSLGGNNLGLFELNAFVVHIENDLGDDIARLDTSLEGRAILDGRYHQEHVGDAVLADLHTYPGEVALDLFVEAGLGLGIDVSGVGVQIDHHPLKGDVNILALVEILPATQLHAGIDQEFVDGLSGNGFGFFQLGGDLGWNFLLHTAVKTLNRPCDHLPWFDLLDIFALKQVDCLLHGFGKVGRGFWCELGASQQFVALGFKSGKLATLGQSLIRFAQRALHFQLGHGSEHVAALHLKLSGNLAGFHSGIKGD